MVIQYGSPHQVHLHFPFKNSVTSLKNNTKNEKWHHPEKAHSTSLTRSCIQHLHTSLFYLVWSSFRSLDKNNTMTRCFSLRKARSCFPCVSALASSLTSLSSHHMILILTPPLFSLLYNALIFLSVFFLLLMSVW